MKNKKTLVILVHPNIENSVINARWKTELEKYPETIKVHELYKIYPDGKISGENIKKEQSLVSEHDNIIFQFPLYWYSSPSLLKEWIDTVFEEGWAYGENGNKLENKNIGVAVSVGGPEKEYNKNGSVKFSLDEVIVPFKATAIYVGANFLPVFSIYDTVDIEVDRLNRNAKEYTEFIKSIL